MNGRATSTRQARGPMRGLAFPSDAVSNRETSYEYATSSMSPTTNDDIPIDPALTGESPMVDPALVPDEQSMKQDPVSIFKLFDRRFGREKKKNIIYQFAKTRRVICAIFPELTFRLNFVFFPTVSRSSSTRPGYISPASSSTTTAPSSQL